MKNPRFPARFLTLFLTVCMAASLTSLPALAEEDPVGNISVTNGGENVNIRINDDNYEVSFDEEGQGSANGQEVPLTKDDSGAITVNVSVGSSDEPVGGTGVEASATGGGQTEVNAGNVNASGDESRGVSALAEGGNATVNADALSVTGDWSVGAEASASSGTATVNAGSVSASGEGSTGIHVSVSEGGMATVTVGRDDASGEIAAAEGEATGAGETAAGSGVQTENAATPTETTGSDASGTEGKAETPAVKAEGTGIAVENNGGTATVTVDGDVDAAKGIDITQSPAVEETAVGDVSEGTGATSCQAENTNQTTVTVNGDVNASDTAIVVNSVTNSEDRTEITVYGNITTEDTGISVSGSGKTNILIEETLSAGQAVVVDEHVTKDNLSLTVWKIEIDGKAPTENDKLVQPAGGDNGNEAGSSDIVENTYNTGAVNTSENSTSIVAGTSIATDTSDGESKTFTDASIQYIIKVEAPDEDKGTLKAADGSGNALSQSHGYDVAKEGDTVTLKVEVKKGYKLTGAYNGEGNSKVAITADANGNYFITVPKGGGVYLSVTLEKDKTEVDKTEVDNNQNNNQDNNQDNNQIPTKPEKAESPINVSVVSNSRSSNGNSNGNGNDVTNNHLVSAIQLTGSGHVEGAGELAGTFIGNTLRLGTLDGSRRLEAIQVELPKGTDGGIQYRAHLEDSGWTDWAQNGERTGTTGQFRRLEAVQMRLTGAVDNDYSVWYRVHSQNYGWLGWAHNGETAGTTGLSKRAEAIDIQVLPEGQVPDGYDAYKGASVQN